jgi:hypothetical protein
MAAVNFSWTLFRKNHGVAFPRTDPLIAQRSAIVTDLMNCQGRPRMALLSDLAGSLRVVRHVFPLLLAPSRRLTIVIPCDQCVEHMNAASNAGIELEVVFSSDRRESRFTRTEQRSTPTCWNRTTRQQ